VEVAEVALDDATVPRSELWADRGVVAGVTMRGSGFNLGLATDEPAVAVLERWRVLGRAMRSRFPSLVTSRQVHGTTLGWHDRPAPGLLVLDGLDGHLTDAPGVLLTVSVADCVPVYLLAPRTGAVALLHAGWRGVAAGILECGLALFRARAGVLAGDIVMHCGVAICGRCYEVGPDVLAQFPDRGGAPRGHVDLRGVLAGQAHALGIDEQTRSPWCSAHDTQFFSHRASHGRDGRMVAYLGRPLA
jgi:copper oxidase (laccase) domain-containing protein